MLTRTLLPRVSRLRTLTPLIRPYSTPSSTTTSAQIPANDPNPKPAKPNVSATNATPTSSEGSFDQILVESVERGTELAAKQAPNRDGVWSRNQQKREVAMQGPRFEQTIFEDQPRPYAAIELIHKQPVRWTDERIVSCDGGGGPLGHPRVFINTDKPQICWCEYCGLPFAHKHHRAHIEAQGQPSYPLDPTGDAAEVPESQKITDEILAQR